MRRVCRLGFFFFFFQAEDGIRDLTVTGVQTCALPIWCGGERGDPPASGAPFYFLLIQEGLRQFNIKSFGWPVYGFISSTGVFSCASMPSIFKIFFRRLTNLTILNPIGFGRKGILVANTPFKLLVVHGFIFLTWRFSAVTLCIQNKTTICENPLIPASASFHSGEILMVDLSKITPIGFKYISLCQYFCF